MQIPPKQWKYFCCCYSVAQSCPTLCDSMNGSMPGFPVLHHLLEFAQTDVHWVSDAILPSLSLSPSFSSCLQSFPSTRSFPMSLLFASATVLPVNIHTLLDWLFWFPYCPRDSRESFPASQFKSINSSVLCCFMVQLSHPNGKTIALTIWTFVGKVKSLLFNTLSRIANWGLPWWLSGKKKSAC